MLGKEDFFICLIAVVDKIPKTLVALRLVGVLYLENLQIALVFVFNYENGHIGLIRIIS